jgi:hypothetical protein
MTQSFWGKIIASISNAVAFNSLEKLEANIIKVMKGVALDQKFNELSLWLVLG